MYSKRPPGPLIIVKIAYYHIMLLKFEKKVLRSIYGLIKEKMYCQLRWNSEIQGHYKDVNTVGDIKFKNLGWEGHIVGMEEERTPPPQKKFLNGKFF